MPRMLFFMESLKKNVFMTHSQASLAHLSLIMFTIYRRHFMALHKFLGLGFLG
jgi:hypothetical protein